MTGHDPEPIEHPTNRRLDRLLVAAVETIEEASGDQCINAGAADFEHEAFETPVPAVAESTHADRGWPIAALS